MSYDDIDPVRESFDENFAQELCHEKADDVMGLDEYGVVASNATAGLLASEAEAAGAGMRLAELIDGLGVVDGLAYAIDKDGAI